MILPISVRSIALQSLVLAAATACAMDPSAGDAPGSVAASRAALAVDPDVVISQIYGGGGNSGAVYTHDFIELFNRSAAPVTLSGWSLQYSSATGTGNLGANAALLTDLNGLTIGAGQYLLVQEGQGAGGTTPLPAPDSVDPTPIAMSATAGKVALVRTSSTLGCNGGSTPCSAAQLDLIEDLVGYGNADFFEGSAAAPGPGNTNAAVRAQNGCADSNQNGADFATATAAPRNSASPATDCDAPPPPPPPAFAIHEIQGAAHLSPLAGEPVTTHGVVTALRNNGFYLQDDLTADADPATSEGIFVFTASAPAVAVGDRIELSATVEEFRPGCSGSCPPSSSGYVNLTTTELSRPSALTRISSGNPLPAPIAIGNDPGDRRPPLAVIDDDTTGSVETPPTTFDPDQDGIDFYESLEGMRVQLDQAVAVGPTADFGATREIWVLSDAGGGTALRTPRGGIVIAEHDFNPERIALRNDIVSACPDVHVGDRFDGTIVGVMDYAFGAFKLEYSEALPAVVSGGLARETLSFGAPAASELTVATFNVENLDPGDPATKLTALAALIVGNLGAPDLLALEEVQDDNGATNDAVVSDDATLSALVGAIAAAGGPGYAYRSIDPQDDRDGGEPGGNIRVALLFRSDRGLAFVDRPGALFDTANTVVDAGGAPQLAYSPGRIDPSNPAYDNSRKPLAAELTFLGQKLFVIANHFNSKGGDQPLFGRFQPPELGSEAQRVAQAQSVSAFVQGILALDTGARVIVLGDLNDFEFSAPVATLEASGVTSLVTTLPAAERYSYVFEGNSQVLDHIMVSPALRSALSGFDVVHVNAEFHDQASDHDPSVARFRFALPPAARLTPIIQCVAKSGNTYTARFGYRNPNAFDVAIPVGLNNLFVPMPINRGQPTVFRPGRIVPAFEVRFSSGALVWLLDGNSAVATISPTQRCR